MKKILTYFSFALSILSDFILFSIISFLFAISISSVQTTIANTFAPLFLGDQSNFKVSQIDIGYDGKISIQDLFLDLPGFSFELENLNTDISLRSAMNLKFIGKNISINGLNMRTKFNPNGESDTTTFKYSSLPFCSFENVLIKRTNLYLAKYSDVDSLLFPSLTAKKLILNDSIVTDKLTYSDGSMIFVSPQFPRPDTLTEKSNHLVLPSGIPKFRADTFLVDNLNFNTYKELSNEKNELKNINFSVSGWSNTPGARLELKELAFIVQDSIEVSLSADDLSLKTEKNVSIQQFQIQTELVYTNIKEAKIEKVGSSFKYSADLDSISISPNLLSFLPIETNYFSQQADDIHGKLKFNYSGEQLELDTLSIRLGESYIGLKGGIKELQKLNSIELKSNTIYISKSNLNRNLSTPLSIHTAIDKILVKNNGSGSINKFLLNSEIFINNQKLRSQSQFYNDSISNNYFADLLVSATKIDFATLLKDSSVNLNLYNTVAQTTRLPLDNLENADALLLNLKADSVRKSTLIIPEIDCDIFSGIDSTYISTNSLNNQWLFNAKTYNNIFKDDVLSFIGDFNLQTIPLAEKTIINGSLQSRFQADICTDNSSFSQFTLENTTYLSDSKNEYQLEKAVLFYSPDSINTAVKLKADDWIDLELHFNDSLMTYVGSPSLSIDSLPNFEFYGNLSIDTLFLKDFADINFGIKIQELAVVQKNRVLDAKIQLSELHYEENLLLKGSLNIEPQSAVAQYYNLNLSAETIQSSFEEFHETEIKVNCDKHLQNAEFTLISNLMNMSEHLNLSTNIDRDGNVLSVFFKPSNKIAFGERVWLPQGKNRITFNHNSFPDGNLAFINKEEQVLINLNENQSDLRLENFRVHNLLAEFTELPFTDATLNTKINYSPNLNKLNGQIAVTNIQVDSILVGDLLADLSLSDNQSVAELKIDEQFGAIHISGTDLLSTPLIDAKIQQLDLAYLHTIQLLDSSSTKLSGKISGDISGRYASGSGLDGKLSLDQFSVNDVNTGISASTSNHSFILKNNYFDLNNLKLYDSKSNDLAISGGISIQEGFPVNISVKSERFTVVDNLKNKKDVNGEISISSDINIVGDINKTDITGHLKVIEGSKFNYYYQSELVLEDKSNVVTFVDRSNPIAVTEKAQNQTSFNVNYDLNVEIGSADIYVLLSKTSNEYFKINGTGGLNILGNNSKTPNVFGKVQSNDGHVYYELPVVSTVQLDIETVRLVWNGDLTNPMIKFDGREKFMVTPNQISSQLNETAVKVPIVVHVEVPEVPLEEFELLFTLSSENEDVNNIISSLPKETEENYALDLLTFGKINRDGIDRSTSSSVVDKMNEISRRNLKNSDLAFTYDSYETNDLNSHESVKTLGYNYSKKFLEDKVRVTIGGALNWGENDRKSHLFGDVQIDYVLAEDPDFMLQLKKSNVYTGPIDGETSISSVGIEWKSQFKNLFKRKAKLESAE